MPPARLSTGALWRLVTADIIRIVSLSLVPPVLAVALTEKGASASAVGAVALMPYLGILLMSPLVPALRARLGAVAAIKLGMGLSTLAALGFALGDSVAAWGAAALLAGLAAGIEWVTVDSLVAECAPPDKVGRLTGLFQTLVALGFAAGPAIPALFTLAPAQALWVPVALEVVAWVPTLAVRGLGPERRPASGLEGGRLGRGTLAVLIAAPGLAAAGMLGGVFENGMTALSTVQATHLGYGAFTAVLMPTAIALGSLVVQYPVGWLADKVAPRRLMEAGAVLLAAGAALLAFTPAAPWLIWPVAVAWGAVGGSLYTLTMTHVGVVFRRGNAVPAATAAAVAFYTGGAMLGPAVSGPAMDLSADYGLAVALGVLSLIALTVIARDRGTA